MDAKVLVVLVVGVLVGGGFGFGGAYIFYAPKINELTTKLNDLELQHQTLIGQYETLSVQYETLTQEYGTLSGQYENLKTERDNLQNQYSTLSSEYKVLQSQYNILSYDYDEVSGYLKDLSSELLSTRDLLDYYCCIPEAFQRVLIKEELEKIASTVSYVTHESQDSWYAYDKIYKYVADNINYAYDIEFPHIDNYYYVLLDGSEIITSFSIDNIRNYIQTPEFTLEYKQGDCDDQAVLTYAMIKYYMRNIYGTEYSLYIADIEFSGGSSHLAVFLPVQGGQLCILDPAGHHLTSRYGHITQYVASFELQEYSNEWSKTTGEITYITLYDVNVIDGSYEVVASGTIDGVADFFEKS